MKHDPRISQQLRFRYHSWLPEAPEVLTLPQNLAGQNVIPGSL